MNQTRRAFLDTSRASAELLGSDEVAGAWDSPSALAEWNVSGLCGHLVRATTSVEHYLDRGDPDGDPVSPAHYYAAVLSTQDLSAPLHVAIRVRGDEAAVGGHPATVARLVECLDRLEGRLESEPDSRKLAAFKDLVLTLDDYLVTRVIELVVHIDDVAVSVGGDTPRVPDLAYDIAIGALVDTARHRHGDVAVIRALARRERDRHQVLRVL